MSGKPYPETVAEVVSLVEKLDVLSKEHIELKPKWQRFTEVEAQIREHGLRLQRLLSDMDLEAQGNHGFGSRMGYFIMEMYRILRVRVGGT